MRDAETFPRARSEQYAANEQCESMWPSDLTARYLLSLKCGRPTAGLIQHGIDLETRNDPRVEWSGWIHVCRMNSPVHPEESD